MTPIETARGEIGVTEYPRGSNKVKYNAWYYGREVSGDAYPWCMAFVQWCFWSVGRPLPIKTASCGSLLRWYEKYKSYCVVRDKRKAKANDIVIYDWPSTDPRTDHTGIVERVEGDFIVAIEGNTGSGDWSNGGAVMRCRRPIELVAAIIRPYEEEDFMTGEEIYNKLQEFLADKPLPEWAKDEFEEAKALGITDGTAPEALIPRYQAAIMALRAVKNAKGNK